MRKRVRSALAVVGFSVIVLSVGTWGFLRALGPVVNGRPLASWLKQLESGLPTEVFLYELNEGRLAREPKREQAAAAIRKLGTNGLPYLVYTLTNVDSNLRSSAQALLWRVSKRNLIPSASDSWQGAANAFVVLGPIAKSVTPDLGKALNRANQDWRFHANVALALAAIGPAGQAVLSHALSSTNFNVRLASAQALSSCRAKQPEVMEGLMVAATNYLSEAPYLIQVMSSVGQRSKTLVPFLISELQAPSTDVRKAATEGLGRLGQQGELVIPALIAELQSTNVEERLAAINALGGFNQQSELVMPDLIRVLQSSNTEERLAAVRVLGRLGSRARSAVAELMSFVQEAEKQEGRHLLPQLLNPRIRARFLAAWWGPLPFTSQEAIVAAIAESLDRIDLHWTNALPSELVTGPTLEQWHALGKGVEPHRQGLSLSEWVALSGRSEPQHQGRTLRDWLSQPFPEAPRKPSEEWLKQTFPDADLKASEQAVKAIGTNGIPWLLVWLQSSNEESVLLSKRGFGMLKVEAISALPALFELAQSSVESTRHAAYSCIARIDSDWEVLWPALIPVLHSPEPKVRLEAAEFLYRFHPEETKRAGVYDLIPPIPEPYTIR